MPGCSADLSLRPRLAADLGALCDVWEAATRSTHPFLSDEVIAAERKALDAVYFPATRTLVALRAGQIVGFGSMRGAELAGMFVAPEAQRSGVGRAILSELCGAGAVTLEVYTLNMHGRAAWHRLGFAEAGRRVDAATGLERVQMVRPAKGA